jgi:hypothetical protein
MESIRTYEGDIRLCRSCGQPSYLGDAGRALVWRHFREQWDGVHCPRFPLADNPVAIEWDDIALMTVKATFRDTSGPAFTLPGKPGDHGGR